MPLHVNIGLNKKVGEPNYGSRGACGNLQAELDSAVIEEPERLRTQIRRLFALARQSLDEELHKPASDPSPNGTPSHHNTRRNGHHVTNRIAPANGSSASGRKPNDGSEHRASRTATQSQIRALHKIAGRQGLDLTAELRPFRVFRVADLSVGDASRLIDDLNSRASSASGAGEHS
ncbi:MAG: hypothetical protein KDA89_08970 [Planctomycetaceae bacterium]|nr:hypothetical protein [Planctomycetaceae bacterium]